jgi:GNAT superfamily N-acetyltransferase
MMSPPEDEKAALDRLAKHFYADLRPAGLGVAKDATIRRYGRDAHPPRFPAPADVEVIEVGRDSEEPFAETVALGSGLPASSASTFARLPGRDGWHCYLALADGDPVAAGAMLVEGDVAQFGLVATLESARGKKAQMALLHRQIEDAISLGVDQIAADVETGGDDDLLAIRRDLRDAGFEPA